MEFETSNNKKYEVEKIWNSAVYAKESATGHLLELYYLISWKDYSKEESTWELALVVQHLRKLLSAFHKDNSNKPTATSLLADSASPIAQLLVALFTKVAKQKCDQQVTSTQNKEART